ncbi:MAG: iron-containing alcohol dehydrogenase, partial [Devosia sp.]|nr:iron-containing alcohol dehydrogenase [Devosia sp.]
TILDVVGPGKVKGRRTALAQVPTTSGTGSEAGIRALVTNPETLAKFAIESQFMLADLAILDPELTYSVPSAVTAATGVDALAHCVEAFTNIKAHPLIDGYARLGIELVGRYLARAVADGSDTEARAGMMLASYYGGICLGPVNTAAGHALAYPLGTRLKAGAMQFCRQLGVEMGLGAHGAEGAALPDWAVEAHAIRRLMDNNPRAMSIEDVLAIYQAALN